MRTKTLNKYIEAINDAYTRGSKFKTLNDFTRAYSVATDLGRICNELGIIKVDNENMYYISRLVNKKEIPEISRKMEYYSKTKRGSGGTTGFSRKKKGLNLKIDEISKMNESGLSINEIAAHFKCTKQAIHYALKRNQNKVEPKPIINTQNVHRITENQSQKIRKFSFFWGLVKFEY